VVPWAAVATSSGAAEGAGEGEGSARAGGGAREGAETTTEIAGGSGGANAATAKEEARGRSTSALACGTSGDACPESSGIARHFNVTTNRKLTGRSDCIAFAASPLRLKSTSPVCDRTIVTSPT